MKDWIPLFQTGLWIGLIVWLILRYKTLVSSVLTAVQNRIERGSSVKAGPFELGESIKTQTIDQQKNRLEEDRRSDKSEEGNNEAKPLRTKNEYILIEDLALRKVQAEFGAPINRQVSLGRDVGLDGMFTIDGAAFAVEVKYVVSPRGDVSNYIPRSLEQIQSYIDRFGWQRFTFILVIVFERKELMNPPVLKQIQDHLSRYGEKVLVRFYEKNGLKDDFGIE